VGATVKAGDLIIANHTSLLEVRRLAMLESQVSFL
jgi:hypothetical protein